MKITVKTKYNSIIIDESDNSGEKRKTSIRWQDEMKYVQETIVLMVEQCKKLNN